MQYIEWKLNENSGKIVGHISSLDDEMEIWTMKDHDFVIHACKTINSEFVIKYYKT